MSAFLWPTHSNFNNVDALHRNANCILRVIRHVRRDMNSSLLSGLFFLVMGLFCTTAICDAEDDAKKAFDAGKKLYSKSDFDRATQKFREAYRIRPTWKLLYNIAQSEVAAKRYGMAIDDFEQYLIEGGDEIPADRQDKVREELKRLREMVGTVQVKAPNGSTVWVDGTQRGTAPLVGGILIPAGRHRIEARVNDEVVSEISAKVRVGSEITVDLMPSVESHDAVAVTTVDDTTSGEPSTPESTSQEDNTIADTQDPGKKMKLAGIVTIAVGGAALIAGGVTGGLALGKEKTLEEECTGVCDDSMKTTRNQRDNLALTTNILWGVGAAAVTTGLILWVVGHKRSTQEQTARLHPVIAQGYAGMHLQLQY